MTCVCSRCGYTTIVKINYKKHLTRVNKCLPKLKDVDINELLKAFEKEEKNKKNCPYCLETFFSRQEKHRHIALCKLKKEKEILQKNLFNKTQEYEKINTNNFNVINNITNTTNNTTNNTNNTYNTINTTTINLFIYPFGKFNNDHDEYIVKRTDYIDYMISCIENKLQGVFDYISYKHFNPDHPENHNIRLSKQSNCIDLFDGLKWITYTKEKALNKICHSIETDFHDFLIYHNILEFNTDYEHPKIIRYVIFLN